MIKIINYKRDLTRYSIPSLNRIEEGQFNQILEANLERIDGEVRDLVRCFL